MANGTTDRNRCGSCTLCCKIVGVLELEKPPHSWCEHCAIGAGCRIYESRPESCSTFECFWLSNEWIPDALRPDRSKIVLEGMEEAQAVLVMCDPGRPDAWRRQPMQGFLAHLVDVQRIAVVISRGPDCELMAILPEGRTMADLFDGMRRTGLANLGRYAEQAQISLDAAVAQLGERRSHG